MSNLTFTVLGCGNSTGVPAAGGYWGACDPQEPKNRRLRPSLLVKSNQTTLVIDTGPDFSAQATRADIQHIDAALYTHSHGDHMHGIDDLKRYAMQHEDKLMPIHTNHETLLEMKRRFYYLFDGGLDSLYKPMLKAKTLNDCYGQACKIGDITFTPFEQIHGNVRSVGYRFGDLTYATDVKILPEASYEILQGTQILIIDSAGYHQDTNPVHANLKEIYAIKERLNIPQVYLTSLSLQMDYKTLCKELPEGIAPLYDGMIL